MVFWKRIQKGARTEAVGLVVMSLTWLGFFWRQLFLGKVYFTGDVGILFYPLEFVYGVFQHARQLPVWSNEFGFGHPLISWGQLGFFTPIHVILRELKVHPLNLIQVSMMAHFALGLLGMYVWFRRRRLDTTAAALGAIVFVLSGYNVSHILHINFFVGIMMLPWGLVVLDAVIKKVTIIRVMMLGLVMALIAFGPQAQIGLYCLLLLMLIALILTEKWTYKLLLGLIVASVLGVLLSSLTWWPLWEFLPYQDRTEGITTGELYNYSYPPWQVITLIFPTYFGTLGNYWGENSYVELGSYVGLLPLLLAAVALIGGHKNYQRDRAAAMIVFLVGVILILGRYAGWYRFLVTQGWWPPFTAPSRWLLFVVFGIAWLSAMGMNRLTQPLSMKERGKMVVGGLVVVGLVLLPFILSDYTDNWQNVNRIEAGLVTVGLGCWLLLGIIGGRARWLWWWSLSITVVAAGTLVSHGWRYYPVENIDHVTRPTVMTEEIKSYNDSHDVPARIYSDKVLLRQKSEEALGLEVTIRRTGELGETLMVYQLLAAEENDWSCINLAIESNRETGGAIDLEIRERPTGKPLRLISIKSENITDAGEQKFCFDPIADSRDKNYWLTVRAIQQGGSVQLPYSTLDDGQSGLYLVRVKQPTEEQWERSKKSGQLIYGLEYGWPVNSEHMLMVRHLNATAGASGARWIGSISIRRYRDFVKELFANDRDTMDGDGQHVIIKNRNIFNLAGVTHFAQQLEGGAIDGMPDNGFRVVSEETVRGVRYRLYENEQALPRAFVVSRGIMESNRQVVFAAMRRKDFNPREAVYLEDPTGSLALDDFAATDEISGEVEVVNYQPERVDIRTSLDKPGWLVLTDSFTPWWKVYVDDRPAPQLIANQLFRATRVTEGEHIVSFRYRSPAVENAKRLTAGGIMLMLILWAMTGVNWRMKDLTKNS